MLRHELVETENRKCGIGNPYDDIGDGIAGVSPSLDIKGRFLWSKTAASNCVILFLKLVLAVAHVDSFVTLWNGNAW